ncbi:MAG TPA: M12 family metallo-peptidase [Candidatus Deferrimicrobium sp.]|nr:M12 family metallo-peptidase [Candidatus Deferrimicrobium sp.]
MIPKSIQKKLVKIFICLSFFMLLASPVFSGTEGSEFINGIFVDALNSEAAPFLNTTAQKFDPTVIRSRLVKVDFGRILQNLKPVNTPEKVKIGDETEICNNLLHLNLFDDASFIVRLENVLKNVSGSTTYIGSIDNEKEPNRMIFTVKDNVMIGSFTKGNKNYIIRYIGGNIHEIQETDHNKFGGCEEPLHVGSLPGEEGPDSKITEPKVPDTGAIIDVMVVYTAAARTGAGSVAAMEATIDQAVAETNTGYSNSQITPTINLVHTAEVTYSESSFNWTTCVNRLQGTSDGYMDNVHTLRNTYRADMVVLIVENSDYCGQAYTIMANSSGAFCLVSRSCATGYYSFAHEMGHLQGARHDRYMDNTDNSPYTYNHGRTYPTGQWRTIMAYDNACVAAGVNCTRINYWSNPSVFYNGVATGISGGAGVGCDNHLCLNNTAYTVANFRESVYMTVSISGPTKGYNSGTYTWCANVSGSGLQLPYTYDWRYSYDGSSYTYSFGSSQCETAQLPLDRDLYLKVTVTDSNGIQAVDYHVTINMGD